MTSSQRICLQQMIDDYRSAQFPLPEDTIRSAVIIQAKRIKPPPIKDADLNGLLVTNSLPGYP